jgi:hypothetical protein
MVKNRFQRHSVSDVRTSTVDAYTVCRKSVEKGVRRTDEPRWSHLADCDVRRWSLAVRRSPFNRNYKRNTERSFVHCLHGTRLYFKIEHSTMPPLLTQVARLSDGMPLVATITANPGVPVSSKQQQEAKDILRSVTHQYVNLLYHGSGSTGCWVPSLTRRS